MFKEFKPTGDRHRTKCAICAKRRMCHKCICCEERMCTSCSSETKESYVEHDRRVWLRICEYCLDEAKEYWRN